VIHQKINSPAEIDLSRDALIEASAGTGKTFTLTHLVVRTIRERKIPLDRILIVTYTEKAAGEMRERLRELLEKAVKEKQFLSQPLAPEEIKNLREQALSYDQANIQTIHAFCMETLQRYAFENGFHFQLEQADDREIAHFCLRELLDTRLPVEMQEQLEIFLALSGFHSSPGGRQKSCEEQIATLAITFNPDHADLLPDPEGADFDALPTTAIDALNRLLSDPVFASAVPKFTIKGRQLLEKVHQSTDQATALAALSASSRKPDEIKFDSRKKTTETERQFHSRLLKLIHKCGEAGMYFYAFLVKQTGSLMRQYKDTRHQISFEDMLTRVEEGLARKEGHLLHTLRERFHTALVDEFQDTDPVQWSIFRRVFLESSKNRLFIIGDPKQAIYSFRGADIHTYYEAAETIQSLTKTDTACYQLPINRRSAPQLIKDSNLFFKACFSHQEGEENWRRWTGFRASEAPSMPLNSSNLPGNQTGLFRCEIDGNLSALQQKVNAAQRIAAACQALLSSGTRISIGKDNPSRPVNYKDICILTRTHRASSLIEETLLGENIPCTIYKKRRIYSSDEALHTSLLLRHLAAPQDSDLIRLALLTPFFEKSSHPIPEIPDPESRAGVYLAKLQNLAANRNWGGLFRAILTESGIAIREYPLPGGERRLTNLEQIFQNLESTAVTGGLDIHRLAEQMERLIKEEANSARDENLHRIESEEPRIQIMTIHSSKGLQFPFVYVTAPLEGNGSDRDNWHTWPERSAHGTRRVYDLLKKAPERHKHEVSEEGKRLLYVALTRGIFHTCLFFSSTKNGNALTGAVERLRKLPDTTDNGRTLLSLSDGLKIIHPPSPLFPEAADFIETGYKSRRISLASFSSLVDHVTHNIPELSFGESGPETDEQEEEEDNSIPEITGSILLPRGPKTGNLLHTLLETIPFETADTDPGTFIEQHREWIRAAYQQSRIRPVHSYFLYNPDFQRNNDDSIPEEVQTEAVIKEICTILYNALTTPLEEGPGKTFRLCEIKENDRKQELEFHFYLNGEEAASIKKENGWFPKGYFTGFIDLVFRRKERYHILDWKSNWLRSYDSATMRDAMNTHSYGYQAAIYREALNRWLKAHNLNSTPGNVYYLFLRGVTPQGGGVYRIADPAPFPAEARQV